MKRRHPSTAMSLFSYLDGLVCTMGALILLLLLTTHRIREQVLAEHRTSPAAAPLVPVPPVIEAPPLPPVVAGPTEEDLAARKQEIAERHSARQRELELYEKQKVARLEEWDKKLRSLTVMNEELAANVDGKRQRVASLNAESRSAQEQAGSMFGAAQSVQDQTREIQQAEEAFKQQAEELLRLREENLKKLEAAQVSKVLRNPVFEIETRDSTSGTTRRPILIECTADKITFCSEGITLSASTLNDYTPEYNPLLAGTMALMSHWQQVDGTPAPGKPGPYVLMVVRPGGTVGFYVVRSFLEKLGSDFGYELVSATSEFQWPEKDPQAAERCQQAIDDVLSGKAPPRALGGNGLLGRGAGGSAPRRGTGAADRYPNDAKGERIVGENGEFSLSEVDQLRNSRPGDAINMLGPEWTPPRSRRLGTMNGGTESGSSSSLSDIESEMRSTDAAGRNGNAAGMEQDPNWKGRGSPPGSNGGMPSSSSPGDENAAQEPGSPGNPFSADGTGSGSQGLPQSNPLMNPSSSTRDKSLPPPPLTAIPESGRKWINDGGPQRKWGRGQTNGAIGIERTSVLHLKSDRFEIIDGPQVGIPVSMTRMEYQELVSGLIDYHARSWGEPPQGYFWRPSFEIKVHPGGQVHYPVLKELMEYWGLGYKVQYIPQTAPPPPPEEPVPR